MTTPTHIVSNILVYLIFVYGTNLPVTFVDLGLMILSNLIDLDHLLASPIYHPRRNPFKTHIFHKHYVLVLFGAGAMLWIHPLMFLGIGLLLHIFLDYLYIVREKL